MTSKYCATELRRTAQSGLFGLNVFIGISYTDMYSSFYPTHKSAATFRDSSSMSKHGFYDVVG